VDDDEEHFLVRELVSDLEAHGTLRTEHLRRTTR
jgi:hypothetical protein